MTLEDKVCESLDRIHDETLYVLEHERSADEVMKKVSARLVQIVAAYKIQGVCPTRRELEECCAMILAIGIACDTRHHRR